MPHVGFLSIDKPEGVTSRDVVNRVVRILHEKRCGHAGTLDPLATGVLVLAVGKATRLIEYAQDAPKTYRAEFRLGEVSNTDDREGTVVNQPIAEPPTREKVASALSMFVGEIQQTPPAFSAIKVKGRRSYDLARKGEEVVLAPRKIRIYSIDLLDYGFPVVTLRIRCGAGTYIRSLARDLGNQLGTGALMSQLRREAVGSFRVENSLGWADLDTENLADHFLPYESAVANLPSYPLNSAELIRFSNGLMVPVPESAWIRLSAEGAGDIAVTTAKGRFAGIARLDRQKNTLKATKAGFLRSPEEGEIRNEEIA